MRNALLAVGAILPVIGAVTYMWAIIRGPVRPQRMTRLLLAIVTTLSLVSLMASNDQSGVWLAAASFIESMLLLVLSVWHGIGGTSRLDIVCLLLCAGGVAWWLISGDSFAGLVASIVADLVACIPSLVKTVRLPHTESALFYGLGVISAVCVVIAGPYGWRAVLFPAYLALIDAAYVWAIWRPVRLRRGSDASLAGETE
jgi:hypothetical protein